MTAYVDASVILRLALGQPNVLTEWSKIQRGVSSALITTESLRTLDRLRLRAKLSDVEVATRRAAILSLIASLELVDLDAAILAQMYREAHAASERFASEERCTVEWSRIWSIEPVPFHPVLLDFCDAAIRETPAPFIVCHPGRYMTRQK